MQCDWWVSTFWKKERHFEKRMSWGEWLSPLPILLKTQRSYPQHFCSHQKHPLSTMLNPKSHTESNVFVFAWDLWVTFATDWTRAEELAMIVKMLRCQATFHWPQTPPCSTILSAKKIAWASRGVSQASSIHLLQLCTLSLLLNKSLCLMPFQWMANCKPAQMKTDMKSRFFQKHSI